jgi:cystathionine beta-lyase/cystathionine gamma-synthase
MSGGLDADLPSTLEGRQEGGLRASRTRLEVVKISNNLGDAKSLITHPATIDAQEYD